MSKIVVVGANHAGTACINTMLDNFGNENEIVVFDQNSNISFITLIRRHKIPIIGIWPIIINATISPTIIVIIAYGDFIV